MLRYGFEMPWTMWRRLLLRIKPQVAGSGAVTSRENSAFTSVARVVAITAGGLAGLLTGAETGRLADRWGARGVFVATMLLQSLAVGAYVLVTNVVGLIVTATVAAGVMPRLKSPLTWSVPPLIVVEPVYVLGLPSWTMPVLPGLPTVRPAVPVMRLLTVSVAPLRLVQAPRTAARWLAWRERRSRRTGTAEGARRRARL